MRFNGCGCIGLAFLLCSAAPMTALAREFKPQTENEKLLMQRIEKQDQEIEALKEQVRTLTNLVAPSLADTAKKTTAGAATRVATTEAERVTTLEKRVDEVTNVLSTRVEEVEKKTDSGKVVMTTGGPRFESASGDFSLQIVGALQGDAAFYKQGAVGAATPKLNGGTNFRRAHIGVQGTAYRDISYALIIDAAATGGLASAVRDATISYSGLRPFVITMGNQKPQTGLETSFSDRSNASTFLEPGLSAQLLTATGTRNIGVRVSTGSDHYALSLGIYGDDINNNGVTLPSSEGWGGHGRLTWAPVNSAGKLIHLGVSGYWRSVARGRAATTDPIVRQLRFRAQPEVTVDSTRLVDTGNLNFAREAELIAGEAAAIMGPISVQGEYVHSFVQQDGTRLELDFDGAYAALSWFLTGESRVYDGRSGVFTRVSPKRNFTLKGGSGAFELAGRWSFIDLDSNPNRLALGGVRGGRETDYTFGFNWYANPYLRLMFNYIHADVVNLTNAGLDEGGKADIFAMRVHQEW
jgi:phosphate-selective porin OprO/OprP